MRVALLTLVFMLVAVTLSWIVLGRLKARPHTDPRRVAAMQTLLAQIEDVAAASPDLTGQIILDLIRKYRRELP